VSNKLGVREVFCKTNILHYFKFLGRKILKDDLIASAESMALITALGLVPVSALLAQIFGAFDSFSAIGGGILSFFTNLIPGAVGEKFSEFIINASSMGSTGAIAVVFIATLLMYNIDHTLDKIWKVKSHRSFVQTIPLYWIVLSLTPIIVGTVLAIIKTNFIDLVGNEAITPLVENSFTFILAVSVFASVYKIVPNRPVVFWHAIIGAIVAALLVFLAKQGLLFYHEEFEVYKNIYKELATIPVVLLWLALTWLSILIGAQVTYTIGAFRVRIGSENFLDDNASLYELVRIVRIINSCNNKTGIQLNELMKEELHMSDDAILDALNILDEGEIIHRSEKRGWKMSRTVSELSLGELYRLLEEHLSIPRYFKERDQCLNDDIELILGSACQDITTTLDSHKVSDFLEKK